jgi:ribonucleoside-diphosphate reductase alpha chain
MDKALEYFNGNEMAAQVWQSKYAAPGEETPNDMHKRMSKELSRAMSKTDTKFTEEFVFELLKDFKYIVPQGSIMATLGVEGKVASLSNCFVVDSPRDSYGGILKADEELVQLMKRRGGVGVDISSLRPRGVKVKNAAGTSTGAASFMERFSSSTREVAQDGRRGALMLTISIDHPDAEEFVNMKGDRSKVTGANVSVMLTDDFMQKALRGDDFIQKWPCDASLTLEEIEKVNGADYKTLVPLDGKYAKKVNAKELYASIVFNAWDNAEPGQLFIDRLHGYSPDGVYDEYKTLTTNPCSEIGMGAYDACRLVAINLFSYVVNPFTEDAYFNYTRFHEHCGYMQIIGDAIVDLELEHIDRILAHIKSSPEPDSIKSREVELWQSVRDTAARGRRTGCGITALGDTLAALGFKYDSERALGIVGDIMRTKFLAELTASTELARKYRPFSGWNYKKEKDSEFFLMVKEEFPELWLFTSLYGRRNVSWGTIAPTGSLSILTQTSSGLEPMFMPFYTRRRKINPNDKFNRVDFVDQNGDQWMEYPVLEPKFKMWMEIQGVEDTSILTKDQTQEWFEKSPWYGSCAGDIDWERRVDMQAVCQKYISHSISSTINIPNTATQEDVERIYVRAWQKGLKGVTVYRDGCRTGVLIADAAKEEFAQRNAPKRPKRLTADVYHTKSSGSIFTVFVGLMDGKPYEVFARDYEIAKQGKGEIVKKGKGKYVFVQNGEEFDMMEQRFDANHNVRWALSRLVSTALRHGADIKFVTEQLRKSGGSVTDYTSAMARVLSKYTKIETLGEACPSCGAESLIREEGCYKCKSCGWTKCG